MKLFVYGKVSCRGDERVLKFSIDSSFVERAISLINNDEDEKDDFLYSVEGLNWEACNLLTMINQDNFIEGQSERIEQSYDTENAFYVIGEEHLLGVAPTKLEAKLQYLKADGDTEEW